MPHQPSYLLDRNRPITQEEIENSFQLWKHKTGFFDLDSKIEVTLRINSANFDVGWLKAVRAAMQISYDSIANKLKTQRSNIKRFEINEVNGSISLAKMKEYAEAMDCEFIYAVRPKSKMPVSKIIWDQILPEALKHPWLRGCDQNKRHLALVAAVNFTLNNQKFRNSKGWSVRKFEQDKTYTSLAPTNRKRRISFD